MTAGIEFSLGLPNRGSTRKQQTGNGYRIYILANFSGQHNTPWQQRPIRGVDLDNFEEVMGQFAPRIALGETQILRFEATEDFHPDHWLGKIKLFADLQQLKRELTNPATAANAAAKIQQLLPDQLPVSADQPSESQADMFERLLGKRPDSPAPANTLDTLLAQLVAPHITPAPDPHYQALIHLIDSLLHQCLQTLLHSQDFRSLEALWLALQDLVHEECADQQQIYLLDISGEELADAAQTEMDTLANKLSAHLQNADDEQSILLVGNYVFNGDIGDRTTLNYCSELGKSCGGLFLAAAGHELAANLLDRNSPLSQQWQDLRKTVGGEHLVLAYPGVLQRLPYGAKRDPLQSLDFEECATPPNSDELLWSNPAFLAARFLIRAQQSVDENTGFFADAPAFSYVQDGESVLQAATETRLTEKQAQRLWDCGIMPVISFRQRRGVKLLDATPVL